MSALDEKKDFSEFYLSDELQRALKSVGYKSPTPVQASSIPLVMAGIDLIVQSQTGTGKTAAFAIPIIEMVEASPGTIEVLVLAPTRELAKQVNDEFDRLGVFRQISSTAIYGGSSYEPQLKALKTAQVVCATPGRLLDLLERGQINLSTLRFLIIDEADEMLSMGFDRDVRAIVDQLPEQRQSLLFSATITEEVNSLAKHILFYPEFLTFSNDSMANKDVQHSFVHIHGVGRTRDLLKLIEFEEPDTAIIFANTKADTFMVHSFLKRHGYKAEVLNGDLDQKEREKTLGMVRQGQVNLLVATDVAARGIDIEDLSHVINYTLPDSPDVYVHRTGRTGRAGKKGTAISLVSNAEKATFIQVKKYSGLEISERTLPTTEQINAAKHGRAIGRLSHELDALPNTLAYGAKLGMASELLKAQDSTEAARVIAKLMALAELRTAVPVELPDELEVEATPVKAAERVEAKASTPKEQEREPAPQPKAPVVEAQPEPVEETEEIEAVQEEAVVAPPEPSQPEEADEASEAPEDSEPAERSDRRRRSRRSRGRGRNRDRDERDEQDDSQEQPSTPAPKAPARAESYKPGYDVVLDYIIEEEAPAKPQFKPSDEDEDASSHERPERRRRGRGRGRGRGRDDRSSAASAGAERPARVEPAERPAEPRQQPKQAPVTRAAQAVIEEMSRMFVNVGRNAFSSPEEVIECLSFMSGMDEDDFGKVELDRQHAVVEVRQDYLYDVIHAIHQQDWKGRTLQARQFRD